jgi:hypothetical protein
VSSYFFVDLGMESDGSDGGDDGDGADCVLLRAFLESYHIALYCHHALQPSMFCDGVTLVGVFPIW